MLIVFVKWDFIKLQGILTHFLKSKERLRIFIQYHDILLLLFLLGFRT